jgi:hypothetical protein
VERPELPQESPDVLITDDGTERTTEGADGDLDIAGEPIRVPVVGGIGELASVEFQGEEVLHLNADADLVHQPASSTA